MVNEIQPAPRPPPDELVVPGLVLGSALAGARRAITRSRRIPGLSLLFVGAARGLVKTVSPHVPALPWSVGLSPALLWGWAARGDRAASAPFPGASAPSAPPQGDARALSRPPSNNAGADAGLEAVAPALVLVRGLLGAPVREARSGPSAPVLPIPSTLPRAAPATEPLASRASIRRRARGGWGLAWSFAAARPTIVRGERSAGQPISSGATARAEEARFDHAFEPSAGQIAAASGPAALPWSGPPILRSGAAGIAEPAAPLRLPRRDPRADPVALHRIVEVTDALRTFVTQEVQEVKNAVARANASRPPEAAPQAILTPSDDTLRKLLSRMRIMMQEERFRSGKLR